MSPAIHSPRLRIAISGGGVSGLSLAAFICQHSTDVVIDVYEKRSGVSESGDISLWKRSWQALQDIGLEEEVRRRNLPLPRDGEVRGPTFRKADQPVDGLDFHDHVLPYGPLSIPRPTLIELLRTKLNEMVTIHAGKEVVGYEQSRDGELVAIQLADGSTTTADVLIGCDGVHSMTRRKMYQDLAKHDPTKGYENFCEAKWSGSLFYRATLPKTALKPSNHALGYPKLWCGKHKHAVSNPIGDTMYFVFYYNEQGAAYGKPYSGPFSETNVPAQEVADHYKGWDPSLVEITQTIENPSRWAIHVVDNLPYSASGRVALGGDAAHAMMPHQGVGGGQGIEDAHILGRLLAHEKATPEKIPQILLIYQDIRLPKAQKAADRSRNSGHYYEFTHPEYPISPNATMEELKPLGEAIGRAFEWLGQGKITEDWAEAEARLLSLD